MKKLYYRYEIRAEYTHAVSSHYMHLRCIPICNSIQQIYGKNVTVTPSDSLTEKKDGQGNILLSCRIDGLHTDCSVISEGIAFVDVNAMEREILNPYYRYFTDHTRPDQAMEDFFRAECVPLFSGKQTDWERVHVLMHELYSRFSYVSGITAVETSASEAFALGKGVCQDYAQCLIALCRLADIPARYAAGFLLGEGATHAWVEIFDSGYWYGFDPTHNRVISDDYIKVAHGRDALDCPLEKGVFYGSCGQCQTIRVFVKEYVPAKVREKKNDRNNSIGGIAGG